MNKIESNKLLKEYFEMGFRVPHMLTKVPSEYKRLLLHEMQHWLRVEKEICLVTLPWRDQHSDSIPKLKDLTYRPMIVGVGTFGEFPEHDEALEEGLKMALDLLQSYINI